MNSTINSFDVKTLALRKAQAIHASITLVSPIANVDRQTFMPVNCKQCNSQLYSALTDKDAPVFFMFCSQCEHVQYSVDAQYCTALVYARTVDSSIARVSSESYECSYCSHKQAYTAFDASGVEQFSFCLDCIAQEESEREAEAETGEYDEDNEVVQFHFGSSRIEALK